MIDKLAKLFQTTFNRNIDKITALKGDGSDRTVYRMVSGDHTIIGVEGKNPKENEAFLEFSKYFRQCGLPVPAILAEDRANGIYLEEDLGDETLFIWMNQKRTGQDVPAEVIEMYKKILSFLPVFQIQAAQDLDFSLCYQHIEFGRESMMWDLHYFKQNFLNIFYSGKVDNQNLENDFQELVRYLLRAKSSYFLYRDFQSRNVMIKNNSPHFIDYQSGRRGALQYDLASMLYDAKANIPQTVREELLDHYLVEVKKYADISDGEFMSYFYEFALIRILQALGAYGFLGIIKGKKDFLKSIPFALKNLQIILNKKTKLDDLLVLKNILSDLSRHPESYSK